MRVNFTIEGPPIGKARPRVTRTVTYTPAKTARYEDLVRYTAINSFDDILTYMSDGIWDLRVAKEDKEKPWL